MTLPVDRLEESFTSLAGPRVVTAPPGSGKSTRVPLWCRRDGAVLVVQPRRVAARSLATHVARQDGTPLGKAIGYAVRGASADDDADVLFVTPGVALRMLPGSTRFRTVVLDEFHERTLDLDLLLALVHARDDLRLVVLSATLAGDRVAEHLGGTHLEAEGRLFPVDVRYTSDGRSLPTADRLGERVRAALQGVEEVAGDRLVFVPGRAEMAAVVSALQGTSDEVLELHGRLTLDEQNRVFEPGERRRVVVATNIAETSVTLPRIGVVIDAGLVRRTHYHQDRGYLLLGPIASDSADQRAGRAGRLGPGVAVRLWGARAPLATFTPPEIQRESLVPLVLAAAVAGHPALRLPFLDAPPKHAVDTARGQLLGLGAIDARHRVTDRGRRLFRLPMEAHFAHLLVVAEEMGQLAEAIDLCAALTSRRPLFRGPPKEEDDLREGGCDATALVRAVRIGEPRHHGLDATALRDVRREATRLRNAFGDPDRNPWDRQTFARVLLRAWPRSAHIARRRKRHVAWSNGGTEVGLDRRSAVHEDTSALLALDFLATGRDRLNRELRITAALPVGFDELADLGCGEDRLRGVTVERGAVVSEIERVYAGTVLRTTTRRPTGALARAALAELLHRGTLWKGFAKRFRERHALVSLSRRLSDASPLEEPLPYLEQALETLGLEDPDELALLSEEDLLPPAPPADVAERLRKDFPSTLTIGAMRFEVEVNPKARTVVLHNKGARLKKLPPTHWLPAFRGFRVAVLDRGVRKWLRG